MHTARRTTFSRAYTRGYATCARIARYTREYAILWKSMILIQKCSKSSTGPKTHFLGQNRIFPRNAKCRQKAPNRRVLRAKNNFWKNSYFRNVISRLHVLCICYRAAVVMYIIYKEYTSGDMKLLATIPYILSLLNYDELRQFSFATRSVTCIHGSANTNPTERRSSDASFNDAS